MLALRNIRAVVSSHRKVFDSQAKFHSFFNNLEACQKPKIPTKFSLYVVFSYVQSLVYSLFPSYLLCNGLVFFITGK